MEDDKEPLSLSRMLSIGAVIVVVAGGISAYWASLSEMRSKLSEVAARQQVVFARLEKMDTKVEGCAAELVRRESYIKAFDKLEAQVQRIEQMLIEHNDRVLPPLGKKSGVDKVWKPDG